MSDISIMDCDVIAGSPREAMREAKKGARDQGWYVADVVRSPYSIGRFRWRLSLAVVQPDEEDTDED